jgi:glycosyltransferase involved in cell wall biosynthesis
MNTHRQPKLCYVTTVPSTFTFLKGQIGFMQGKGFHVIGITNPGPEANEIESREHINVHTLRMTREISLFKDLFALFKMARILWKVKPTIINASTPKGSLLGIIAARLTGVPVVIYTLRGLPYVTKRGVKKALLMRIERLVCMLSDLIITTSFSTRRVVLENNISNESKTTICGYGTGNGIDYQKAFNPRSLPVGIRNNIREKYSIPKNAVVIGFVGRIVFEKGVEELAAAWGMLKSVLPGVYLMVIGREEAEDLVSDEIIDALKEDDHVIFTGPQKEMAQYYAAMDINVLPSHREGIGLTPLEAGAMEKPSVVSDIDGLCETVIQHKTGIKVPVRHRAALYEALRFLAENHEIVHQYGKAARQMVMERFCPDVIWNELDRHYTFLLGEKFGVKYTPQADM